MAKLEDGSKCHLCVRVSSSSSIFIAWSAPSAIGTAGLGVGGQAGAEMTDFLVVLNSRSVSNDQYLLCCFGVVPRGMLFVTDGKAAARVIFASQS